MKSSIRLIAGVVTLLSLGVLAIPAYATQNPSTPQTAPPPAHALPTIVVTGVAPLPALGLPLGEVPSVVQQASGKQLQQQHSLNVADFLNSNFAGINVNQTQDNPFQMDVNYHGFKASALLGAPEGLSVYQDGVRVNEAFGGVVNWDLIPTSSIAHVSLISGATSPVFGLNTLGGALAIQTKDGRHNPGTELQVYGGSFGRADGQFETGGTKGHFDYFLTTNFFHENGWRDLSPSLVRQAFGKVGWQDENTSIHLSYNWANNDLIGNGVTPRSMLAVRREAIFTAPDQTVHKLNFANLTASHWFSDTLLLSGNLYWRRLVTQTLNGDVNDDYTGAPCATPEDCATGVNHRSQETENTTGLGLQLTDSHDLFGKHNRVVAGVALSRAGNGFLQTQRLACLDAQRATTSAGPGCGFLLQTVNDLSGHTTTWGLYLTDTFSPSDLLHLTVSARYNHSKETLGGQSIGPSGHLEPFSLDQSFHRLNPAIGITVTPNPSLTFYADYNEGSRAPTVIELGCADPAHPCGLPNDFAADPPLKPVVARTFQIGARGSILGQHLMWDVNLYRTRLSNDIQLVATNTSEGYFDNVGDTRRQGIDLGLHGKTGRLKWHLTYSFVDATYQSGFSLVSESNSSCRIDAHGDCVITIRPGDRIPLVPRQTARLVLNYAATDKWTIGANIIMSSGQYLRGNENNDNRAGGTTGAGDPVIGSGHIGGYTVVNLNTDYRVTPKIDVFLRIVNLFNDKYATSGFLTGNPFNPDGTFRPDPANWTNEDAIAPGTPRAAWVGLRVKF